MDTQQIKSLIRHSLTAIGVLITMVGLDKYIHLIAYLQDNLDTTFAAITTLVGVGTTIVGFFKDKTRWQEEVDQK